MWCLTSIQKAASVLEEASQASDSQRGACAKIAAALVQKPLSDHQDKVTYAAGLRAAADGHAMHHLMKLCAHLQDVKTYTAFCLAHVLRLHTADCPYSTAQQRVMRF